MEIKLNELMSMTAKNLAALLNGREYGSEITSNEALSAAEYGLVVVFGASDDLAEFRGAIDDEADCYDGGTVFLDGDGIFNSDCDPDDCKLLRHHLNQCKTINAIWGAEGYSWIYETGIPYETFEIMEDGEKYCRGIVFEMAVLKGGKVI